MESNSLLDQKIRGKTTSEFRREHRPGARTDLSRRVGGLARRRGCRGETERGSLGGEPLISRQLCRFAAGGSRERPLVTFCPAPPFRRSLFTSRGYRPTTQWVIHGSRLLPTHRSATL